VAVVRLLLRPGTRYADRRDAFHPFDRLVEPDPQMRADTVTVARRALAAGKRVFVLVNNKAEGVVTPDGAGPGTSDGRLTVDLARGGTSRQQHTRLPHNGGTAGAAPTVVDMTMRPEGRR
jgi:hypothetical protein